MASTRQKTEDFCCREDFPFFSMQRLHRKNLNADDIIPRKLLYEIFLLEFKPCLCIFGFLARFSRDASYGFPLS